MNAAERKRKQREKLKKDPVAYKAYLKKEMQYNRKRKEKNKKVLKLNPKLDAENRRRERDSKRKYRLKKKQEMITTAESSSNNLGSYSCTQTLGKAVAKIKKNLPASPRKKVAVTRKLLFDFLTPEQREEVMDKKKQHRTSTVSEVDKMNAIDFFLSDEYSWQSPERKHAKKVTDPTTGNQRVVVRKYLTLTVSELYELFCESYPDTKIGKSIFYSLKPSHVFPTSLMPHNVCACVYHENFKYLISALCKQIPDFPADEK